MLPCCRHGVWLLAVVVVGCVSLGRWESKAADTAAPNAAAEAAKPTVMDVPLVPEKVRQLMQDRAYAQAVAAIDEAAKAPGAPVDYLTWLKGRALSLDNRHDEAVAVFDTLQKQFPKSPWLRRARFAKAVALARKGDFRAAETIYRAEAEWLLSADRKQQIAELYLEFADAFFKPPKEEQKPDYAKALAFYKKALEVGPKPQKRAEVELLVGQCHQKLGKLDEAAALYDKFTREHGDSPLDIEARFHLGECRLAQGKLKEARRGWQDLLAKYPDSRSERIAEAAFLLSRTWGVPLAAAQTSQQSDASNVQQQAGGATGVPPVPTESTGKMPVPPARSPLSAFRSPIITHHSSLIIHPFTASIPRGTGAG